ncbi:MAG: Hsp70 family protein [Micrococcales bacterium]|nr:Hsp70 family protein [Micrococcales bacterium]
MPVSWILAVDFGTTNTGAAIRFADGRVEKVKLDPGSDTMPSAAVLTDGHWRVGRAALNARWASPQTFVGSPKTRLGQETLVLGEALVDPAQVAAGVVASVRDRAVSVAGGGAPDRLVLTHPARWGQARLAALRESARLAGFPTDSVRLLPEPIAALHAHVPPGSLPPGSRVAVVDIGGGTCDVAVLHVTDDPAPGKDLLVVAQEGDDQLGGDYLDDLLYQWVVSQLGASGRTDMVAALAAPANQDAAMTLLDMVRSAKQDLSEHTSAPVAVSVGGHKTTLTITRDEYETLIAEPVARAADLAARALAASATTELAALYLTGGTAYTPALARALHQVTGILTAPIGDPKLAVAIGALKTPTAVLDPSELFQLTQELTAVRQAQAEPQVPETPVPPDQTPPDQTPQDQTSQDQTPEEHVPQPDPGGPARPAPLLAGSRRKVVVAVVGALVAVGAVAGLWAVVHNMNGDPKVQSTSPSAPSSTAAGPSAHACWDGTDDDACSDFGGSDAVRHAFAPPEPSECVTTRTEVGKGLFYEEDCSANRGYQPYTARLQLWVSMDALQADIAADRKKAGTWKNSDGDTVGTTYTKKSFLDSLITYCYDTIPVCLLVDQEYARDDFGTLSASQVRDVEAWLDTHAVPDPTAGWNPTYPERAFPAAPGASRLTCKAQDLSFGSTVTFACRWPDGNTAVITQWSDPQDAVEYYKASSQGSVIDLTTEPWIVDGVARGTLFSGGELAPGKRWCYDDVPYCIAIVDWTPDTLIGRITPLTPEQAAEF